MSTVKELIAGQSLNNAINKKEYGNAYYWVTVYGAKGDGINDDTAAIQKTIEVASTNGGGTIFFPSGTYFLNSMSVADAHINLFNIHNIRFEGVGEATILKAGSKDKDLIRISGGSSRLSFASLTLERIDGATSGGNGVRFHDWFACPYINFYQVTIRKQWNGIYSPDCRPQVCYFQNCHFRENENNGVDMPMNNDVFFDTCVFGPANKQHGASVGGSTTKASDGAVYFSNCMCYFNVKNGYHFVGTSSFYNVNVFIDGGFVDNNGECGIYAQYTVNLRISVSVTWNSKKGLYIGNGTQEVYINGLRAAENAEEGLYIDAGAKFITGSNIMCLSNSRATTGSYYGIKLNGICSYIMFSGVISGNGSDIGSEQRQTQKGGLIIEANGTAGADYVTVVGALFPAMTNRVTKTGSGTRIHIFESDGSSFASQPGEYFGFAGAGGGQRIRYNSNSGNIEFESTFGSRDGTWNGAHNVLGSYHLWVDTTGRLRIKNGAPSSETDGTVVGSQT